ncbi:MAG: ankyrin repeat domain-containing protein [Methylococcaceae bacterium]|jgi:ankyrin repeat protein
MHRGREAAGNGDILAIKLFLAAGMNVNATNGYETALGRAAQSSRTEVVKLLLDNGANPNVANGKPFFNAVDQGSVEVVKLLLDKGADINTKDALGHTAISSAAGEGNTEMVKLLLDKGADPNSDNGNPIRWAVDKNFIEIVELLLDKGADSNTKVYNETALSTAAAAGNIEMVKLLLDKGADINARTQDGYTALMFAIMSGHIEIVNLLLDRGADTKGIDHAREETHHLPLEIRSKMIELLDKRGITDEFRSQRSTVPNPSESNTVLSAEIKPIVNQPIQLEQKQTVSTPTVPVHKQGDFYTQQSINLDNGTIINTTQRKVVFASTEKMVVESKNVVSKRGAVRSLEFTPEWNLIAVRNADGSGVNYSPPLKYYEFPLTSGKTWRQTSIETNIKTGAIREHTLSAVVGDWENVTVPAGTFRGVKVTIQAELVDRTTGQKTTSTDTSWYVPEVRRSVRSLTSSRSPEGVQSRQDLQLIRYEAE